MYTLNTIEVHCVCFEPGILEREGGHIYKDKSGTLRAKPGDNQMTVAYGLDTYNQTAEEEKMQTIRTNGGGDSIPKVAYSIENHPNDSRVKIAEDGKVQTLTERMGTGGGNVPIVMMKTRGGNAYTPRK